MHGAGWHWGGVGVREKAHLYHRPPATKNKRCVGRINWQYFSISLLQNICIYEFLIAVAGQWDTGLNIASIDRRAIYGE